MGYTDSRLPRIKTVMGPFYSPLNNTEKYYQAFRIFLPGKLFLAHYIFSSVVFFFQCKTIRQLQQARGHEKHRMSTAWCAYVVCRIPVPWDSFIGFRSQHTKLLTARNLRKCRCILAVQCVAVCLCFQRNQPGVPLWAMLRHCYRTLLLCKSLRDNLPLMCDGITGPNQNDSGSILVVLKIADAYNTIHAVISTRDLMVLLLFFYYSTCQRKAHKIQSSVT